ncbi:MAG: hypothetical protein B7X04_02945 [Parcubacteria group bacterium 21-54-25]|nr:MAG: hypothetical protein B7X04_02945 [Parcubacteria group bacterium 21-54-25]HQU07914.1 aminotransferase class V-fold PLP-dependent enzyme [Candidatus Paceibacterota bacterium]
MQKLRKRVYLDWAAAAPVAPRARRAFTRALAIYGNPSGAHAEGRAARMVLEDARRTIARLTEVKADDIIFTSGATEANALALLGHIHALRENGRAESRTHLLYLPTAHRSVIETVFALMRQGVAAEPLPLASDGRVDTETLVRMLRPETALISMDAVCGETGTIWNTREVRRVLEHMGEKGPRPLLHVDASQAPLATRITRSHWGADLLVLDAQKAGGVRGIGALIAHRTIPLVPLTRGGGHERGVRPGTEPVALAASFAAALEVATAGRERFVAHAAHTRHALLAALAPIPALMPNGGKETVPHIVNISLVGRDTDYLVALLDEAGFAVSTRSACETDAAGSHVVLALTNDVARAASTLRISWGPETKEVDCRRFAHALAQGVAFLDGDAV